MGDREQGSGTSGRSCSRNLCGGEVKPEVRVDAQHREQERLDRMAECRWRHWLATSLSVATVVRGCPGAIERSLESSRLQEVEDPCSYTPDKADAAPLVSRPVLRT